MSRFVLVFGTSHRLQGAVKGRSNINDPTYAELIERLISEHQIDFILEEATGLGPTTAERIALSHWGQNRYLDVDPSKHQRPEHEVSEQTGELLLIDPEDPQKAKDVAYWENVEAHIKKEKLWFQGIHRRVFTRALMIGGPGHLLSFSSK